jgi:hypothetical protein
MIPKTLSATALQVAELCPARYKAEHIDRAARMDSGTAATLGSTVHSALELFVKHVFIEHKEQPSLKLLTDLFRMQYMSIFGTADTDTEDFTDGMEMLMRWYERTIPYLSEVEILSCEVKKNFPIPTSIGEIPFNYIYDRFDKIGEDEYKVVDYKTNRLGVRPDELRKRIQVRAYGLAAQIAYPDAKRIWVELDMLRHDGPVGIALKREDNIATWKFLKESAQRIIDTPDEKAPEKLNPECRFCMRKQVCKAVKSNILAGGIHSLGGAADMVDVRAELEYQKAAVEAAIKEIDTVIIAEAKETDVLAWESADNVLEIGASSRRSADAERVEMVIGPDLFRKYGSSSITISTIDKLLKGDELTKEQKSQLKGLVYNKRGEARVSVKPRNPIDA